MKQYVYNADGSLNTTKTITAQDATSQGKIKVYNPDDAEKPGQPYDDPKTAIFDAYSNALTDVLYDIAFITNSGTSVDLVFDVEYTSNNTLVKYYSHVGQTYYYSINGYNVVITVSGETITVTVESAASGYTFTINGGAANSGTINVQP